MIAARIRRVFVVMVLMIAVMARAQESAPAATAPAAAEYLRHFSKDYRTLLVIPDPLPNLQRVLTSQRLQRLWNEGKLTAFIRKNEKRMLPSLDAVWMIILQNARWVPSEIVIGVPETAWKDIDHLVRAGLYFTFTQVIDSDEAAKELAKIQKGLLEEAKQLRLPAMRIWVRFRAEDDAASLFELVSEQAQEQLTDSPLDVQAEENALLVTVAVKEMFPEPEGRVALLEELGVISRADDANAAALAEAVGRLEMEASLERHGDGLLLTIGQSPAGPALTATDLGPLFVNDDQAVLFGAWDVRTLIASLQGWSKLWDEWAVSPIGEDLAAADEEDLGGDLRSLSNQLDALPPIGSSRVWGEESALRFRMLQEQAPAVDALPASPIASLIPGDVEALMCDTVSTFAERASGTVSDIEFRIAQQESRQERRGQDTARKMREGYYQYFDELRQFIHHESQPWFKRGSAFLYDGRTAMRKFEMHSTKDPSDKLEITEQLPLVGMAMIATPATDEQGRQYIERLYGGIVNGAIDAINDSLAEGDPKFQPPKALVKEQDLGLGVKTWTFDASWARQMPQEFVWSIDTDIVPHYFAHNDVIVFSTSTALSKRMLETARGGNAIKLPQQGEGMLVSYGNFPGTFMVRMLDDLVLWVGALTKFEQGPAATRRAQGVDEEMREVFAGLSEYVALVNELHWQTWQRDARRTTDGGMTFK